MVDCELLHSPLLVSTLFSLCFLLVMRKIYKELLTDRIVVDRFMAASKVLGEESVKEAGR
jgi:hypothetical protein